MRSIAALPLVLVLAACSGDNGAIEEAFTPTTSSSTTSSTTTTTEATPESAFLDDLERQLDFRNGDGPQTALRFGRAACDAVAGVYEASTNPQMSDELAVVGLTLAITESGLDSEVAAITIEAAGEHLCPEYSDAMDQYAAETMG